MNKKNNNGVIPETEVVFTRWLKITGLTQTKLAELAGLKQPTVNRVMKEVNKEHDKLTIDSLFKVFYHHPEIREEVRDFFMRKFLYQPHGSIPILTWNEVTQMFHGNSMHQHKTDQERPTVSTAFPVGPNSVAVTVTDDSMRERFHVGDILIVDPDELVNDGDYGVFLIDGDALFRKLVVDKKEWRLKSLNEQYYDIVLPKSVDLDILGKVVKVEVNL